jgi:hypothetical protein
MAYTIKDGRFAHQFNSLGEALRAMRGMPKGSRLYNHDNKEIHRWQRLLRLALYRLHYNWRHEQESQPKWFVINVLTNRVVDTSDSEEEARTKYKGIR